MDNNILVGGSVVMMLIGGITAFVLFGEDETFPVDRIFCRDVSCGSHLVNDDSQRNTIVELKNATHVCCVEKQDENESSGEEDDDDDEDDKSALGFSISLVLLIAMVALVGFGLRTLWFWKSPIKDGKVGGANANRVERSRLSSVSNSKNTEASGVERPSAVDQTKPEENTVDKPKLGFFGRQKEEMISSVLTSVNSLAKDESKKLHNKVDDLTELGFDKIDEITDKGMGLVLKISVVIGILIVMILIGVTVFQGQYYFSS